MQLDSNFISFDELLCQVGNAVTDDFHDYVGTFEYWWAHGLISDTTYHNLRATCNLQSSQHPSAECVKNLNIAGSEQGNIDPYSIYTRPCNDSSALKRNLKGRYVSSLHTSSYLFWENILDFVCQYKWSVLQFSSSFSSQKKTNERRFWSIIM